MLSEVDDTGLSSIICSLKLRNVDNMTAHGGCRNEAAIAVIPELVAVRVGTLLGLPPPYLACSTGTEECTIQVS